MRQGGDWIMRKRGGERKTLSLEDVKEEMEEEVVVMSSAHL